MKREGGGVGWWRLGTHITGDPTIMVNVECYNNMYLSIFYLQFMVSHEEALSRD